MLPVCANAALAPRSVQANAIALTRFHSFDISPPFSVGEKRSNHRTARAALSRKSNAYLAEMRGAKQSIRCGRRMICSRQRGGHRDADRTVRLAVGNYPSHARKRVDEGQAVLWTEDERRLRHR